MVVLLRDIPNTNITIFIGAEQARKNHSLNEWEIKESYREEKEEPPMIEYSGFANHSKENIGGMS